MADLSRNCASRLRLVLIVAFVSAAPCWSRAQSTPSGAWIYIPSTRTYEIKVAGSVTAFGTCPSPPTKSDLPPLYVAFSRHALADVVQAEVLPIVQVRTDGDVTGLDIGGIFPNEAIRSLWTISVFEIRKPLVQRMATARKVSIELGGWKRGDIHVFETMEAADAGRQEVLSQVAKECFQ